MKITFLKQSVNLETIKKDILAAAIDQETVKQNLQCPVTQKAKELYGFKGDTEETYIVGGDFGLAAVFGIGSKKSVDNLSAQKLGGRISAHLNGNKIKDAVIACTKDNAHIVANIAFGIKLHSYRFNKYFVDKKKDKEPTLDNVSLLCDDEKQAQKIYKELEKVADNIFFTRNLVSEPSNELYPAKYAEICTSLKKEGLHVEVLGEKQMTKLGMNALLSVGQGSARESQLVVLKYDGASDKKQQPIAFVGKGVTFDTGGISIKPAVGMSDMKYDMGGSAVVVGLMRLLAQRKAKVNAVGVIGLVENMPSGTAYKPGDVIKSMSGQTIEVDNTDAEGRVVLADALYYTNSKFNPKFIVDLATLTGAIVVTLADVHAGLFSNDDKLAKQIEEAGKKTGETVWRLPVSKEYDEMINSNIADVKNVGNGKGAGSITAAQFLKRFIGDTAWAHLDIAGVTWEGKHNPMAVKGATGYGVKLLNQLIIDNYEE